MKVRTQLLPAFLLSLFVLLPGCTNDPGFQERSVLVTTTDLPPLDASEGHYQLWFSYPDEAGGKRNGVAHGDEEFVSLGSFTVTADGTLQGLDGGLPSFVIPEGYNPSLLIDAILTVEPAGDNDDNPEGRLLAGTFTGTASHGIALLFMGGTDAFGRGFDSVNLGGEVRLLTPSTAAATDEAQGLWFVSPLGTTSLGLRPQPINIDNDPWTYESWLTRTQGGDVEYISLGKFDNPAAKDANGAGPNAGPDAVAFNTPGEDFVNGTVRTLNDGTYGVLVSLQPVGLTINRPFHILTRLTSIPSGTTADFPLSLTIAPGAPSVLIEVDR